MIITTPGLAALQAAETDGPTLILPDLRDEPVTYRHICDVLKAAGGTRVHGGYTFPADAAIIRNDLLAAREVRAAADTGYYPTPPAVARHLIDAATAQLPPGATLAGLETLEPSAGTGGLAALAADAGAVVDCVELVPARAQHLIETGRYHAVICGDFLAMSPRHAYDLILMNPPHQRGVEIQHVLAALDWLRPGGVLAAILPVNVQWRSDKKTKRLRTITEFWNGRIEPLPEDAFTDSGTTEMTATLVLRTPPAAEPAVPFDPASYETAPEALF